MLNITKNENEIRERTFPFPYQYMEEANSLNIRRPAATRLELIAQWNHFFPFDGVSIL